MKLILTAIIAMMALPIASNAQVVAQSKNPVHWNFSVKKLDGDNYRFEAKATLERGFHIWSQDPGGDGSLIPTSFTAEELQNGGWSGEWKEQKSPKVRK